MENLISIFTTTYNRAHTLQKLYDSLVVQFTKNFDWIIVDDGSEDKTKELVDTWVEEKKIQIIYEKKKNEGKHIAINRGVELSKNELFFIVDSDDYLSQNATTIIEAYYPRIKDKAELAGVSFRRGTDEKTYIGSSINFEETELSVFDFRYKNNIIGDMAEVYKTNVLREFPFPKFDKERFCAESLIWNRLGLKYKMLLTSHIIYICHYLEGGLTNQSFELRKKSPKASTLGYSELESMPVPIKIKLKANTNYWRFAKYLDASWAQKIRKVNTIYSLIGFPLSLVFLLKDKK
jgi:glycosyltransferase involved in cell wall biosynthesis